MEKKKLRNNLNIVKEMNIWKRKKNFAIDLKLKFYTFNLHLFLNND